MALFACDDLLRSPGYDNFVGAIPERAVEDASLRALAQTTQPSGEAPLLEVFEPSTQPGASGPIRVTVYQAILTALANNPELRMNQYGPPISQTFEEIERAVFDPVISGTVQGGPTDNRGKTTNTFSADVTASQFLPTGTTVQLEGSAFYNDALLGSHTASNTALSGTVTQSLLRGAGIDVNLAGLREARLSTRISEYELRGFAESLVQQVEDTYWDYAFALESIRIFEQSVQIAQDQLDQAREFVRVGKLAESDLAASEAELAARRENLINARSLMLTQRLQLLKLMGPPNKDPWDREIEIKTQPFVPAEVLDAQDAHVAVGMRMRPEINQAKLEIDRNELEIVRTRNGLLPKLDVFLTLGKTGYADLVFSSAPHIFSQANFDLLVGARFEVPVENRAARAGYRKAQLTREQSIESLNNLEQVVQLDVRSAYVEVQRTREQITATAVTRKLQETKVRVEQEKFKVGKSTPLAVAQAQRDLVQSQIDEINAVVAHLKALVNLYRLEGSLLERRGIAAPGREPAQARSIGQ